MNTALKKFLGAFVPNTTLCRFTGHKLMSRGLWSPGGALERCYCERCRRDFVRFHARPVAPVGHPEAAVIPPHEAVLDGTFLPWSSDFEDAFASRGDDYVAARVEDGTLPVAKVHRR